MMAGGRHWASVVGMLLGLAACSEPKSPLRLNQIQVIGTHNSYHAGMSDAAVAWLRLKRPAWAEALDYAHPDMTGQLDQGIRQLEIDLYADHEGDHYTHPFGPVWEKAEGISPSLDDKPTDAMYGPDFKVMHIVDVDQRSSCEPFRACLETIRQWSDAHPHHLPLFILLETKEGGGGGPYPGHVFTRPETFLTQDYDRLDAELRAVFGDRLLTPDMVRGRYDTLDEAVRAGGWPTLAEARGHILFLFDQKHDAPRYLAGHYALKGRVVFTNAEPGDPEAAFVKRNDGPPSAIKALVKSGYLVRTRADAETREARTGSTIRRDEALASGAQIVSTDYPASEASRWTGYCVALPGQAAGRANPVNSSGDRLAE